MAGQGSANPKLSKAGVGSRKAVVISANSENLVQTSFLNESKLPVVISPVSSEINLKLWTEKNTELIEKNLLEFGGILFRGFNTENKENFQEFVKASTGGLLEYRERSSPRTHVGSNVYTSTEHPPDQSIFLHNEQSYNINFPLKIFFYCEIAAPVQGETPIASIRHLTDRLDSKIKERFEQKKYMYVRNFDKQFGMSWQQAFQTEDRREVEAYCRENRISFEWMSQEHLRTRQIREPLSQHPLTGEWLWFNHLTFFNVLTLEKNISQALIGQFGYENLPNNTYYGDGSKIEDSVLDLLRGLYESELVKFTWKKGDILMLDNMLTAHGRSPFEGPRKILVAMADPRKQAR